MGLDKKNSGILTLHVSIAGELPDDEAKATSVLAKLQHVIRTAVRAVTPFATEVYAFSEETVRVRFVSSPLLISTSLLDALHRLYPQAEIAGAALDNKTEAGCFSGLSVLTARASRYENNIIHAWVCDQADFAIVIGQTDTAALFLDHCQTTSTPAVVLSTAPNGHSLWTEKSAYDSYNEDKLTAYLSQLFPSAVYLANESSANRGAFGSKLLWGGLYKRYMRKNKAAVDTSHPTEKDSLLKAESDSFLMRQEAKDTRSTLLESFNAFDRVAVEYADKYRSAIYLRAVIPLVITIALAVGFYIESLLSPWPVTIPGTTLQLWSILAGLGFFTHALLNLYVYRLSENNTIKSWHKGFIDNRFIAESLRLSAHFIPFGMPLNFGTYLTGFNTKIKKDSEVFRRLRCSLRKAVPAPTNFDAEAARTCLDSLDEFINDQTIYHKRSVNRYVKICTNLENYGKIAFYIGFILVLLRGCLQLFISFNALPFAAAKQDIAILKSFANMLALLVPVWAGYFSSKLALCNFKGLYNNDMSMIEGLSSIKQIIYDAKNKDLLTYEDIHFLSQKTVSLLLSEISEWYAQLQSRSVTRL